MMTRLVLLAACGMLAACEPSLPQNSVSVDGTPTDRPAVARDMRTARAVFQGLPVTISYSPSNAAPTMVRPTDPMETLPTILATDLNYTDLIRQATRCSIAEGDTPRVLFNDNFEPVAVRANTRC